MFSPEKCGFSGLELPMRGSSRELWIRVFGGALGLGAGQRHNFAPPTPLSWNDEPWNRQ